MYPKLSLEAIVHSTGRPKVYASEWLEPWENYELNAADEPRTFIVSVETAVVLLARGEHVCNGDAVEAMNARRVQRYWIRAWWRANGVKL